MAHAYTPGLRVAEVTLLRKERRLPIQGEVLVQIGDPVTSDTVVAQTHLPGHVQLINVASKLGLPPEDLPTVMKKAEGEALAKGDAIAETQGFFGMFKSKVESPCDGTLESVSTVTGQIILREPPTPIQIDAYIDGTIVEVFEGEGVAGAGALRHLLVGVLEAQDPGRPGEERLHLGEGLPVAVVEPAGDLPRHFHVGLVVFAQPARVDEKHAIAVLEQLGRSAVRLDPDPLAGR